MRGRDFNLAPQLSGISPEVIYLPITTLTPNSPYPLTIYRSCFSRASSNSPQAENESPSPEFGDSQLVDGVETLQESSHISSIPPEIIEEHFRANSWVPEWRYAMFYQAHYHSTTHEVLGVYEGAALLRFGISDQEYEPSNSDDEGEASEGGAEASHAGCDPSTDSQPPTRRGSNATFKGYFARVYPGDVVLIPAGVSHRLVKDLEASDIEDIENEIPGLRVRRGVKLHSIPRLKMVGAYPQGARRWDMCYGGEYTRGQIYVDVPNTDPVLGKACPSGDGAKGIELWRKIEKQGGLQKWLEKDVTN